MKHVEHFSAEYECAPFSISYEYRDCPIAITLDPIRFSYLKFHIFAVLGDLIFHCHTLERLECQSHSANHLLLNADRFLTYAYRRLTVSVNSSALDSAAVTES